MEYYSAVKTSKITSLAGNLMKIEDIKRNKADEEASNYYSLSIMWK